MLITKENFEHVVSMMFYAYSISIHNPDCFGSSDLRHEAVAEFHCAAIINGIRNQGYDPVMVAPIIGVPEIDLKYYPAMNPDLKQELDDDFKPFEVDDVIYIMGLSAWNENVVSKQPVNMQKKVIIDLLTEEVSATHGDLMISSVEKLHDYQPDIFMSAFEQLLSDGIISFAPYTQGQVVQSFCLSNPIEEIVQS